MPNAAFSFAFLALAGLAQALFALPVKRFREWRWENMWLAQSVTCNLLAPALWAALLPDHFWTVFGSVEWQDLIELYGWGILWGIGGVAYGLTLTRLGASFAYSFVFGTTTLVGSIAPVLLAVTAMPQRVALFATGLVVCVAATTGSAIAAQGASEDEAARHLSMPFEVRSYATALVLAILAGFFSASYGMAYSLAFPIVETAEKAGLSPESAPLVVSLPIYWGAASFAIPFGLTCAIRSHSIRSFFVSRPFRNWTLAVLMAVFGVGGVFLYGIGSSMPGRPAPNVSFGVFMSFFVLAGNAVGLITGELRSRSRRANALLTASIVGLVVAAWLLRAS